MRFTFIIFFSLLLSFSDFAQKNKTIIPPDIVISAFKKKYPKATLQSWNTDSSSFTASFTNDDLKGNATFASDGIWLITKYPIPEKELSSPIITNIKERYKDYKIKLAEMIEEPNVTVYYYVFAKKEGLKQPSVGMFYTLSGKLIKAISSEVKQTDNLPEGEAINNNENISPKELPSPILSYISTQFPDYTISEAMINSTDKGMVYNITLKKEGLKAFKHLKFDINGKFIEMKEEPEEE